MRYFTFLYYTDSSKFGDYFILTMYLNSDANFPWKYLICIQTVIKFTVEKVGSIPKLFQTHTEKFSNSCIEYPKFMSTYMNIDLYYEKIQFQDKFLHLSSEVTNELSLELHVQLVHMQCDLRRKQSILPLIISDY